MVSGCIRLEMVAWGGFLVFFCSLIDPYIHPVDP
jgi:hypothetical protein